MSKILRKSLLILSDIILVNIALLIALSLRFEGDVPDQYIKLFLSSILIITSEKIFIFYVIGLYGSLWKYAGIDELIKVVLATVFSTSVSFMIGHYITGIFPISVYAISWMMTTIFVGGLRVSYRVGRKLYSKITYNPSLVHKRVLIIGAGDAGSVVINELKNRKGSQYIPVAVLDDDPLKQGQKIQGVRVKGGIDILKKVVEQEKIDEIIITIPSAGKRKIAEISKLCQGTGCKLKTLPAIFDLVDNKVSVQDIRDVNIEDLLGRDEVTINTSEIFDYLQDETVLVTGGGGSIGSELCRKIAQYKPKKLIILDNYENNAYELQLELEHLHNKQLDLEVVIASVRDNDRLRDVFRRYRPGVVFHAAAHKHVPLMESNPSEAIKNNIFGTFNTAMCADEFGVKRFVLISTDKAVNPTNIMGATKRVAEMTVQAMDKISKTEFVAVRFGNVLGSNGSVVPIFKKQIAHGGPITVTHPDITRFFMTIPEAASLVIQAGAMAQGGEIFVLDMGEPVKIVELARELIRLSGFKPDIDIKIEYTGLRSGEKLYEELMLEGEGIEATRHKGIFIAKPMDISISTLQKWLDELEKDLMNPEHLRCTMTRIVPTYKCSRGAEDEEEKGE